MKIHYFLILMLAISCKPGQHEPENNEWIQLFNGKDLTGWDIKISGFELNDNYKNTEEKEDLKK